MHDARRAVAAMRGRIAMNSGTSAHFSDRVEGHARMYATITAVACDEACCNRRSTEHACRAYDVSDGLLNSTARACRGGGGARLRVIVVAGAQSHPDQSQIAVARRR
jgi:hypothetical protein